MKKICLSIFLLVLSFLYSQNSSLNMFGSSVILYNDTPYELIAIVEGADGSFLGQQTILPGTQVTWSKDLSAIPLKTPDKPSVSLTPFRVIWKCPHGGYFSLCSNAPAGGMVQATLCPGNHYCNPKPKKEKQPQCPPCPPCEKPAKTKESSQEKGHEGQ